MSECPMPVSAAASRSEFRCSSLEDQENDGETIELSWEVPERFGRIFDRHFASIFAFCARRVGPVLAEDIVNETFCVAFDRRHRYHSRDRPNARPWLMGIAINVMRHEFRRQLRERGALGRIPIEEYHPDHDASVVDDFETASKIERVHGAITKLPSQELEALLLSALEQLTYEQIAEVLQVPVGTVRSRIHRARKHLGELTADFTRAMSNPPKNKEDWK
jgi:RNA polymerase sigma factor (sigma-70 family)